MENSRPNPQCLLFFCNGTLTMFVSSCNVQKVKGVRPLQGRNRTNHHRSSHGLGGVSLDDCYPCIQRTFL